MVGISSTWANSITVDGSKEDWADIIPVITDPADEELSSHDLLAVSVADDGQDVFFLVEYVGNPALGSNFLALDTDLDPATGCDLFSPGVLGYEYQIVFSSLLRRNSIADGRDCIVDFKNLGDYFPDALRVTMGQTFIEFSVSITTLKKLTPVFTGFSILTANDRSTIGIYSIGKVDSRWHRHPAGANE